MLLLKYSMDSNSVGIKHILVRCTYRNYSKNSIPNEQFYKSLNKLNCLDFYTIIKIVHLSLLVNEQRIFQSIEHDKIVRDFIGTDDKIA